MKQSFAHEQVAIRYAEGVEHVWAAWEPSLERCEQALNEPARRSGSELALELRRSQYRAHTTAEFAAGLIPPPSAAEAHQILVGSLAACRDTLGVVAIRAELDELDGDAVEIGLHVAEATRAAFRSARSSTALVHAWIEGDAVDAHWMTAAAPTTTRGSRWRTIATWTLIAISLALVAILLVDVTVFDSVR